jgi:poly-gamma-glutamate synthesis protein (capsule biosynthesis protein)
MQLLCVGDMALAEGRPEFEDWRLPPVTVGATEMQVLVNWELPIGDGVISAPRVAGPRLAACQASPAALRAWAPGMATLATNHILDAGASGLAATMAALHQAGFATVGAGMTREEIGRPLFWETAEGRLAIVNWVFPETHPDWLAVPGPHCWPGSAAAAGAVARARAEADWVIALLHWSDELFPYPRPADRVVARELLQRGADLVLGHHPHVVRGMEVIDGRPVFYSLGNFFFSDFPHRRGGWTVHQAPRNREGLGVRVAFSRGQQPAWQVVAFWQTQRGVILDPAQRATRRMAEVSRPLHGLPAAQYPAWYAARRARFARWDGRWHFGVRRLGWRGSLRRVARGIAARSGLVRRAPPPDRRAPGVNRLGAARDERP